jgi:GntR family transcriptional regulator/MocR family aminotransferase
MVWIDIDKTAATPLIRQIYEQIRFSILSGKLKAGDKLPSTRALASELGISRIVVMEAYEQLGAEGYIESRQGSGTTVSDGIYLDTVQKPQPRQHRAPFSISEQKSELIDFRGGIAMDLFPRKEWGRLLQKTCLEMPDALFGYDQSKGRIELREAIAAYLLRARGIDCSPVQIFITSGTTQSLAILARILYTPGAEAVMEDPSSKHALRIISGEHYNIVPVPVDRNGLQTDQIVITENTKLVFVTPSHQFPLGEVLPIQRRIELVNRVKDTGCYIIEDDYDSEFRFGGHPISSMYGCDPARVIYLGTFSKAFSPALRLGYVIVPEALKSRFFSCKADMDVHSAPLEQLAMARFMDEGGYERHISRMKKAYYQRQQTVLKALQDAFPGRHTVSGASTGLQLVVEFSGVAFTEQLLKDAVKAGICLYPIETYAIKKGRHPHKIALGYGHLTPEQILEGIGRLKRVIG